MCIELKVFCGRKSWPSGQHTARNGLFGQINSLTLVGMDESVLDNPIWHSLNTIHAYLAAGTPLAKRYPAGVTSFVGTVDHSEAAINDLSQIFPAGANVRLLQAQVPSGLPGWKLQYHDELVQMICERLVPELEPTLPMVALTAVDVPDMLGLVELTKPGPFSPQTIEMGRYVGFRQESRLVAMAGERFAVPGYREISAVCTHPYHQGRGYARQLISYLVNDNLQRGNFPFLHVRAQNTRAYALYETLNFRARCRMGLSIFNR
jgi:ribosomal protein S18 acetylase RimI-like enzyme